MKNNYTLINNIYRTNTSTQHLVKVILMIVLGCILLTLSAKIQVPFWPVPMTMQTFVVFIIGMSYGFSFSISTLFSYLILGAIGLIYLSYPMESNIKRILLNPFFQITWLLIIVWIYTNSTAT